MSGFFKLAVAKLSLKLLSLKYVNIAFLFQPKRKPLLPALKAQGPRPVHAVRYNLLRQVQLLSDSAAWKRLQHASITNTLSSFISISCCAGRLASFLAWISELTERTGWNCGTEKWRTNHRVSHPHSVSLNTLNTLLVVAAAEQSFTCSCRRTHCVVEWRPLLLAT